MNKQASMPHQICLTFIQTFKELNYLFNGQLHASTNFVQNCKIYFDPDISKSQGYPQRVLIHIIITFLHTGCPEKGNN